eukprot:TRINITY_DN1416_c4_g1_i1.p1 TRINITY_DN1416_c4_g1~~TRINITY_DN1416_c4_g1_i1.p1  ORF type:complete len:462 (+),score=81.50 TRINITY_DN1416_c4_g1_i1:41-1426(+)
MTSPPNVTDTNTTVLYVPVPGPSDNGLWWNLGMVGAVSVFLMLVLCTVVWCLLKRKPTLVTQVVKSPLLQSAESPTMRKRYEQELEYEIQRTVALQKKLEDSEAQKQALHRKVEDLERSFGEASVAKKNSTTALPSALKKSASVLQVPNQRISPPKRSSNPSPREVIVMKDSQNKIGLQYSGNVVVSAEPDGPAAQAGLVPGCTLLEINHKPVPYSSDRVSEAFANAGKFVTIKWAEEGLKLDSPIRAIESNDTDSSGSQVSVIISTTRMDKKVSAATTISTRDGSMDSWNRKPVKKVSLREESTPPSSTTGDDDGDEIETSFAESFYSEPQQMFDSRESSPRELPVFETNIHSVQAQQLHLEGACRDLVLQTKQQHSELQRRLSDVEYIIRNSPPHSFSLPPLSTSRVRNLSPSPPDRPTHQIQFNHALQQASFSMSESPSVAPNPLYGYNAFGALTPLE